jgi:hypothetical protein
VVKGPAADATGAPQCNPMIKMIVFSFFLVMEHRWNEIYMRSTRGKTCSSATLSTTKPTWTDPGSNPGLCGERPATNRLSHGTVLRAFSFPAFRANTSGRFTCLGFRCYSPQKRISLSLGTVFSDEYRNTVLHSAILRLLNKLSTKRIVHKHQCRPVSFLLPVCK